MRTNQEKRQHIVLSENQMKNVNGEEKFTVSSKVNFCFMCAYALSDDDIVAGEPDYTYVCPNCGSKATLPSKD